MYNEWHRVRYREREKNDEKKNHTIRNGKPDFAVFFMFRMKQWRTYDCVHLTAALCFRAVTLDWMKTADFEEKKFSKISFHLTKGKILDAFFRGNFTS